MSRGGQNQVIRQEYRVDAFDMQDLYDLDPDFMSTVKGSYYNGSNFNASDLNNRTEVELALSNNRSFYDS